MTEIEVPDWVGEIALAEWDRLYGHQPDSVRMRAALTAALGAWVVPVPQLGDASSESEWFDGELWDASKDDPFYKTRTLYTLRQEKPE